MIKVNVEIDQDKKDFRDEYDDAVLTLASIKDAESMTSAQAVSAIKYIARVLLFVIKQIYKRWLQ